MIGFAKNVTLRREENGPKHLKTRDINMKSKLTRITNFEEDSVRSLTNGYDHESRQDCEGLRQEVTVKFSVNDVGKRSVG